MRFEVPCASKFSALRSFRALRSSVRFEVPCGNHVYSNIYIYIYIILYILYGHISKVSVTLVKIYFRLTSLMISWPNA